MTSYPSLSPSVFTLVPISKMLWPHGEFLSTNPTRFSVSVIRFVASYPSFHLLFISAQQIASSMRTFSLISLASGTELCLGTNKVLNKYWAHKCLLWAKYLARIKKQNSLSSQQVQMNIYYAYILVQAHKFQLFFTWTTTCS